MHREIRKVGNKVVKGKSPLIYDDLVVPQDLLLHIEAFLMLALSLAPPQPRLLLVSIALAILARGTTRRRSHDDDGAGDCRLAAGNGDGKQHRLSSPTLPKGIPLCRAKKVLERSILQHKLQRD